MTKMAARLMLLILVSSVPASYSLPEVDDLNGEADFRSIQLNWKYDRKVSGIYHFAITYCEDQPWGKYRCKMQRIEDQDANEIENNDNQYRVFETVISGLRMATNYTMEVTPVQDGENSSRARAFGREIIIRTKDFSGKATNCLANSSVVEVETGPHFGGMISVEGAEDPRCSIQGDKGSDRTSYPLHIDHVLCGSEIKNTSVETFIIVQENLPILTHSTRRFLVMCNYVPETFTVRAGVNLPEDINSVGDELEPVDQSIFEVDPSELFDSSNNLFDSRLSEDVGRALKMSAEEKDKEPRMWAHLVLMVILVMAAVVGLSCAVWHFVRHARASNRQGFMSPQEEPRAMEETSSMEAVVRDYTQGDTAPSCVENPVALFQNSFVTGPVPLIDQMYDLRDSLSDRHSIHEGDTFEPSPVDLLSDNLSLVSIVGIGDGEYCRPLTLHDLPPPPGEDLILGDVCFETQMPPVIDFVGSEDDLLEVGDPVETFNHLSNIPTLLTNPDLLTYDSYLDYPPSPFADDYPLPPDIYHSPNSSIIVLDPLALHHQSMIHLPEPVLEEGLVVTSMHHPPLSLQHIPQSYFDDQIPHHIVLEDGDDDVFVSSNGEEDEDSNAGSECDPLDLHFNDEDRERAISRHPSLDQNWKLGDGDGQIFPAFSQ